jgi:hypothetical protein
VRPDRRIGVVGLARKSSRLHKLVGLSLNRPYSPSSLLFTFMDVIF